MRHFTCNQITKERRLYKTHILYNLENIMQFTQKKNKKTRNYSFIIYDTPYAFLNALSKHASVSRYCSILHDADLRADGSKKSDHTHILVVFENPVYYSGLLRLINSPEWKEVYPSSVQIEQIRDKHSSFLYLTHESEKAIEEGKVVYSSDMLVSNDLPYFQRWVITDSEQECRTTSQFLQDLLTLSPFQLALKWGRDYIKNAKTYAEFVAYALERTSPETLDTLPSDLRTAITGGDDGCEYEGT